MEYMKMNEKGQKLQKQLAEVLKNFGYTDTHIMSIKTYEDGHCFIELVTRKEE